MENLNNYKVCPNCGQFLIDPDKKMHTKVFKNEENTDIDQEYDKFVNEVEFKCDECKWIFVLNDCPTLAEYRSIRRTRLIDKMLDESIV